MPPKGAIAEDTKMIEVSRRQLLGTASAAAVNLALGRSLFTAPKALAAPYVGSITPLVGFQWPSSYGAYTDTENVIYLGNDGNIYRLFYGRGEWKVDWTVFGPINQSKPSAAALSGGSFNVYNPAVGYGILEDSQHIIYLDLQGRRREIYLTWDNVGDNNFADRIIVQAHPLFPSFNAPYKAVSPIAYYTKTYSCASGDSNML
jgi:hypothetical protein